MPLEEGQDTNFCVGILKGAALLWVQRLNRVVASFRVNIGAQTTDFFVQARSGKDEDSIHATERGEEVGAVCFVIAGAAGAFQFAHGGITVDCDNQSVPQGGGLREVAGMSPVEEVETAVGQHHAVALRRRGLSVGDEGFEVEDASCRIGFFHGAAMR